MYYKLLNTVFGVLGIVWHQKKTGPKIVRIFLPDKQTVIEQHIKKQFSPCRQLTCPDIRTIANQIAAFIARKPVDFDLTVLDFSACSPFQKRVLLAEAKIPHGWVSTYGRIAAKLGVPAAARAVGHALAQNPFPPIIPCHRTVRSDGALGGFQGGLKMKRVLLQQEGIKFSKVGNVIMNSVFY